MYLKALFEDIVSDNKFTKEDFEKAKKEIKAKTAKIENKFKEFKNVETEV